MLARRLILSLVVLVSLVVLIGLLSALYQRQPAAAVESTQPIFSGRYQYFEGTAVPKVFDTQTGKAYVWFPRDEKEDTNPYIIVEDFVLGTVTRVEIKWIGQPTK